MGRCKNLDERYLGRALLLQWSTIIGQDRQSIMEENISTQSENSFVDSIFNALVRHLWVPILHSLQGGNSKIDQENLN